jgi:putative flavoprotein involved in K+ transport
MSTIATPPVAGEVDQWLSRFGDALTRGDSAGAAELFLEECYWRDLVAFTWNIKTMEGRDQVSEMLTHMPRGVSHRQLARWHVDGGARRRTMSVTRRGSRSKPHRAVAGFLRLRNGKVWTLMTTMVELKGHEEAAGFTIGHSGHDTA